MFRTVFNKTVGWLDRQLDGAIENWMRRELGKHALKRTRKQRVETIKLTGGTPVRDAQTMQVIVDLGIQEAQYFGWTPDLLLMSQEQYEALFKGPNGTRQPVTCRDDIMGGQQNLILPNHDNIRVVAYPWIDRMYLVDSKDL